MQKENNLTVGQWCGQWFTANRHKWNGNTEGGYRNLIYSHILPGIGSVALSDLTEQEVTDFYRTIGRAVQLSENTVRKYVAGLEEKGLIRTEPSTITTKDGRVRNGSLIYTIRPIQEALEQNYQRQFRQAEESVERARVQKRLAELEQRSNVKKEESA